MGSEISDKVLEARGHSFILQYILEWSCMNLLLLLDLRRLLSILKLMVLRDLMRALLSWKVATLRIHCFEKLLCHYHLCVASSSNTVWSLLSAIHCQHFIKITGPINILIIFLVFIRIVINLRLTVPVSASVRLQGFLYLLVGRTGSSCSYRHRWLAKCILIWTMITIHLWMEIQLLMFLVECKLILHIL